MDPKRQPTTVATLLNCLLPLLLATFTALPAAAGEFSSPVFVRFFDVGRGDATLIDQPGRCAVLVDAGPPGSGIRIGRHLHDKRIDRLDRLIVSHPHFDHFSGILTLPATLAIDMVNDNGVDNPDERFFPAYRHWRQQQHYRPLASGGQWQCGDILFTVLAVDPDKSRLEEINDSSIVLLVEVGPVRLLLPGDLESGGRRKLATRPDRINATIVKIPHHAKSAGHLGPWLDAVSPALSVISTGAATESDPEALLVVQQKSGTVWRTDLQGDLELQIDARGWRHVR
jgi:beta-lactamase superfamily II metal-dependent hydrolase